VTGLTECFSEIAFIEPFDLGTIGFVCFDTQSAPQCPATFIDCDGGTPADLTLHSNHYVGDCGLSDDPNETDPNNLVGPAECRDLCDIYCAGLPGNYQTHVGECEGYCTYGSNKDLPCTFDSDCPDGGCAGGNPVVHRTSCQCQCIEVDQADPNTPSPPGTLVTQTMIQLIIYQEEPCGIGTINQIGTPRCGWNTTETANSIILNANRFGGSFSAGLLLGSPTDCNEMAYGRRTTIQLVGHRNYIDTNRGDQESATTARTIPRPLVSP
jgi:hypothetical protein